MRAIRPVLAILLTVSPAVYESYLASSDQAPETYRVLALDKYERLLVLAPHCDDEVLGAGGLMQAALRQGLDVHIQSVNKACIRMLLTRQRDTAERRCWTVYAPSWQSTALT